MRKTDFLKTSIFKFKGAFSDLRQFLAIKSPLKMMKNAFYLTLKALFVLKIFKFLSSIFGHVDNDLIRKIKSISKFKTSQLRKQTIPIHILANISRNKDNQTMRFGQYIEYKMRKLF